MKPIYIGHVFIFWKCSFYPHAPLVFIVIDYGPEIYPSRHVCCMATGFCSLSAQRLEVHRDSRINCSDVFYSFKNYHGNHIIFISENCGQLEYILNSHTTTQNLTSPDYPLPFKTNLLCTWTISATEGGLPMIEFVDFSIYHGFDFVYIGVEGDSTVKSLTGHSTPASMIVNATSVQVTFDSYLWDNGYRGFVLQLSWVPYNGTWI